MAETCHVEESCLRPAAGRGMCKTHWLRWRKYGDPYWSEKNLGHRKYAAVCSFDGCEKEHHAHGFCGKHAAAFKKYGDPSINFGKPGRKRKEILTDAGAHRRVRYDRGYAREYPCIDCGKTAQEWSYRGDCPDEQTCYVVNRNGTQVFRRFSPNPFFYDPRCVPCHRHFDDAGANRERNSEGRFV